jgi:hypothetical protein
MKMRKMLIVLFAVLGSYAYADSNETSVEVKQETTETSATEVEKLKSRIMEMENRLAKKEVLLVETKVELYGEKRKNTMLTRQYEAMCEFQDTILKENFASLVKIDELERKIQLLKLRAFAFLGD